MAQGHISLSPREGKGEGEGERVRLPGGPQLLGLSSTPSRAHSRTRLMARGALSGARGPWPGQWSHRASRLRWREKERGRKEGVGGSPWGYAGEPNGVEL
jgi:hypothetical protein